MSLSRVGAYLSGILRSVDTAKAVLTQKRYHRQAATIILLLAVLQVTVPARADTNDARSIASHLRATDLLQSHDTLEVLCSNSTLTLILSDEQNSSEDELRSKIATILKTIRPTDAGLRQISISFFGPASGQSATLRQVVLDDKQLSALSKFLDSGTTDELIAYLKQVPVSVGQAVLTTGSATDVAKQSAAVSTTVDNRDPDFAKQYLTLRSKVASRLSALQARGVGVKPFQANLAKIDQCYKHDDLKGAFVGLAGLQDAIGEQEGRLYALHPKGTPAQTTAASRPGSSSPGEVPLSVLSRDDYYNRMVQNILEKELGADAPADGPFELERFRVAKCIHQYQSEGRDMSGPHYLYKQIEAIVIAKDSSKIPELVDKLNYLQKQLGLPPLQTNPNAPQQKHR
jgi:hypothetical protein